MFLYIVYFWIPLLPYLCLICLVTIYLLVFLLLYFYALMFCIDTRDTFICDVHDLWEQYLIVVYNISDVRI